MNFGKTEWGISREAAWDVLDAAFERGVRTFDTANFYARGQSERILGEWVRSKGVRHDILVMSKAGGADPDEQTIRGLSSASLRRSVEASLNRLGLDHLDVLTLHWPDPSIPVDETLDAIEILLDKQNVSAWAISNYYAGEMVRVLERARTRSMPLPLFSHVHLNLLEQHALHELIPESRQYGVKTVAWSPLCGGFLSESPEMLSGRFQAESSFWNRYSNQKWMARRARMAGLAQIAGLPLHHLALAWLAYWGAEPICGVLTPSDIHDLASVDVSAVPVPLILEVTDEMDLTYPHDVLAFSGVQRRRGGVLP